MFLLIIKRRFAFDTITYATHHVMYLKYPTTTFYNLIGSLNLRDERKK